MRKLDHHTGAKNGWGTECLQALKDGTNNMRNDSSGASLFD